MHVTQVRQLSAIAVALSLGLGTALALAQQAQPQVQPGQAQVQPAQPQVQPGQRQAQPAQPRPGQQPGQAARRQGGERAQGQGQGGRGTQIMAHWLLVDNQGEVALAKFVQEKSQNEEVKEFAKMMIQDHTDFIDSLQQAAGQLNPPGGRGQADRGQRQGRQAQGGQPGQAQPGQAQPAQPQPGQPQPGQPQPGQPQPGQAAGQQPGGGMGFDIVRIKHEIGQQCLESLKEKLSEKKGEEFDKCYMGHQVVAHMQMLDTLEVFKRHASGEMAQLINNGIHTTEDHLQHAENLMKKLDGGAAASTARRPGAERERD